MRPLNSRLNRIHSSQILLNNNQALPISQRCFTVGIRLLSNANERDVRGATINVFQQDVVPSADGRGYRSRGAPVRVHERIRQLEMEIVKLKGFLQDETIADVQRQSGDTIDGAPSHEIVQRINAQDSDQFVENRRVTSRRLRRAVANGITPQIELRLPATQAKSIRRFNQIMRQLTSQNLQPETARSLWRCYRASKEAVPGLLKQLAASIWNVLWDSQYNHTSASDARSKRLWTLIDDMQMAGHPLSACQKMVQIEAKFAFAAFDQAKELWTLAGPELSDHAEFSKVFWTLGSKICLATDNVTHALEFALDAVRARPELGTCAVIPVFEEMLKPGIDIDVEEVAHAYFQLRVALGEMITIEDFDLLTLSFLKNDQPELAIGVFKDLIMSVVDPSSTASSKSRQNQLFHEFQAQTDAKGEAINQLSLKMLQHLPRRFQNKFFYASWLKRLIGLNELESALCVLELMFHRNIRPDARHLNGMITAWMRRGTSSARALALDLGKLMIQARLQFVATRVSTGDNPPPDSAAANIKTSLPPFLASSVPAATIETFSILLLYYESANMTSSMLQLQETLHSAELAPNMFFVNHILHGYLRMGNPSTAWDLYCKTIENRLRPDMHTFAILWDICRHHVELHAPGKGQSFPSPRALFSHMSSWFGSLNPKDAALARDTMTPEIYVQIIRCMYLARDMRGTLVALYALRDMFHCYPDEKVLRLVAMLVARSGEPLKTQRMWLANNVLARRRRSVRIHAPETLSNLDQILRILEAIKTDRQADLLTQGVLPGELDHQQNGEELLWLLGRFLQDCLDQYSSEGNIEPSRDAICEQASIDRAPSSVHLDSIDRLEALAFEMGGFSVNISAPVYTG